MPGALRMQQHQGYQPFVPGIDCAFVVNVRGVQIPISSLLKGGLAGFIETGTRKYADGCVTGPVGYISRPRSRGVARAR